MLTIRLQLDSETAERLRQTAIREKRPPAWQAEVLLRTALGLPFPPPDTERKQEVEVVSNGVTAGEGRGS